MPELTIGYLADHPAALPLLAEAFRAESPAYFGAQPTDAIVAALLAPTLQRAALPLTLVAHAGATLVGTVALRPDSISSRPELGPWVAALHVLPPHRNCGIGGQLLGAAEAVAGALGVRTLYAGSGRATPLFLRRGWRALETLPYHGERLTLLRRDLVAPADHASAIQRGAAPDGAAPDGAARA